MYADNKYPTHSVKYTPETPSFNVQNTLGECRPNPELFTNTFPRDPATPLDPLRNFSNIPRFWVVDDPIGNG